MNESVKGFFNDYTKEFAKISRSITSIGVKESSWTDKLFNKWFRKSMTLRFNQTINEIVDAECQSALDIGCGPGDYSIALRNKNINNITALDFSQNMIDFAQKLEIDLFGDSKIDWSVADFSTWESKKTFDAAIIVGVMDYIEKPLEFVNSVFSVCNKVSIFSFPSDKGFLAWQRKVRYKSRCYLRLYSQKELEILFKDAGENVVIHKLGRDFLVVVSH
jgi:2-polyprenyl-3-methyl-5-hydroxy-6-metoxy-1,4-benzoquinol methylase